ncbi:MAG: hypothetical protein IT537_25330 [Hyphomicrobiales bacterium]|nr:hypothetical protein [Hyphomicrobiales bacterium]
MIPFGMFHPDAAGVNTEVVVEACNVYPSSAGFGPMKSPVDATDALPGACVGSAVLFRSTGATKQLAGTGSGLYGLVAGAWGDISRASGGGYVTAPGERWRFAQWGDTAIAVNHSDDPQSFDMAGLAGTRFTALGGSPPKARYIAVVRDQVVLGALAGAENRVHWSGTNNVGHWTPGTQNCDFQDFVSGGPVRGLIGGAVGYVFLAQGVVRMTQTPGAATLYQFDDVQGAKGLAAPNSLVHVGDVAYYLATDGMWLFDVASGGQKPLGHNKWRRWLLADMRPGTDLHVLGAADPVNPVILWAYVSRNNGTLTPDRVLIYDRVLDEAAFADIPVEAITSWITSGVTLDTMNAYGTLDTLPYSLDSPFWKAGSSIVGLFGTDHKLQHLQGAHLPASLTTADGWAGPRKTVTGTIPVCDAAGVTVAIAARERDADPVVFDAPAGMEDTGECPAWVSGNLVRAQIAIPAGASWSMLHGIETKTAHAGGR